MNNWDFNAANNNILVAATAAASEGGGGAALTAPSFSAQQQQQSSIPMLQASVAPAAMMPQRSIEQLLPGILAGNMAMNAASGGGGGGSLINLNGLNDLNDLNDLNGGSLNLAGLDLDANDIAAAIEASGIRIRNNRQPNVGGNARNTMGGGANLADNNISMGAAAAGGPSNAAANCPKNATAHRHLQIELEDLREVAKERWLTVRET